MLVLLFTLVAMRAGRFQEAEREFAQTVWANVEGWSRTSVELAKARLAVGDCRVATGLRDTTRCHGTIRADLRAGLLDVHGVRRGREFRAQVAASHGKIGRR